MSIGEDLVKACRAHRRFVHRYGKEPTVAEFARDLKLDRSVFEDVLAEGIELKFFEIHDVIVSAGARFPPSNERQCPNIPQFTESIVFPDDDRYSLGHAMYHIPSELIDLLASLADEKSQVKYFAQGAGLPLGMVDLGGPPKVMWLNLLKEARKHERLQAVLDVIASEYPALNWKAIHQLLNEAGDTSSVSSPSLRDSDWNSRLSGEELERITGNQPTFLPLHFFELGQLKAKSVALVQLPNGSGSGFLVDENILLTNNHVLGDVAAAKAARVLFNYQHTLDGSLARTTEYSLSPEAGFATSLDHDWTAVRIDGDANSEWGAIPLNDCKLNDGEYVNIIQHPMGGPKVVAMYHNVVVFSDNDRLQYLTDTLPGSSGSPVFRSDWSLVGIHHSGSVAKDGSARNEGITVRRLLGDLKASGLI